jgi:NAD+ kinase
VKVALRGDDGRLADAVSDAGGRVVEDGPSADLAVAVGDRALSEAVTSDADRPVLPVDADAGRYELSADGVVEAADALLAGEWRTVDHPVSSVRVGDDRVDPAALDAMLVTAEAARISEYAVRFDDDPVTAFRADGVVVATPLGSPGYGRFAGGPLLAPDAGLAVVPVAAFATRRDCWVAGGEDGVTLTVERDEGDVSLVVDGRRVAAVPPGDPVTVTPNRRAALVHAADL